MGSSAPSYNSGYGQGANERHSPGGMNHATRRDGGMAPTMAQVAAVFHLPIDRAAKELHVGQTWLKHMCREHGVPRWPFRKIQSLVCSADRLAESISNINPNTCTDPTERQRYVTVSKQIQQLHDARAAICRGQSPEESTNTAQEAIKAAARRGRISAANRGKTMSEDSKDDREDSQATFAALQKMPTVAALLNLKMEQAQAALSNRDSFVDGSYSEASLARLQTSNKRLREDTTSTADSPRRNGLAAHASHKASKPGTSRNLFAQEIATNVLLDPVTPHSYPPLTLGNAFMQFDMLDTLANKHHSHHGSRSSNAHHHQLHVSTPAQQPSKPRATGTLLKTLHMLHAQQNNNSSSFDLDIQNLLHDQDQEPLNLEQFDDSSTLHRSSYQGHHQTRSPAQYSSPPNHGGSYSMEDPNPFDEYLRPVVHAPPAPTTKGHHQQQQQQQQQNNNGGMQTIAPGRWTIGAKGVAMC